VGPAGGASPAPRLRDVPGQVRAGRGCSRSSSGWSGRRCASVCEGLLRIDGVPREPGGGPRFDFDLVAYGFLHGDFSEENLVIWAVDVAVEKNLGARAVEHFENRCRLLALEKGLPKDRLRKWMIINETADPAAVDLGSRYGIHLSHPTQLRLFLNLFGLEELEREPEPPARRAPRLRATGRRWNMSWSSR